MNGDDYYENPTIVRGSKVFVDDNEIDDIIGVIAVKMNGHTYYFTQHSSEDYYYLVKCPSAVQMCEEKLHETRAKYAGVDNSLLIKDLIYSIEIGNSDRASSILTGLMHMLIEKGKVGVEK